MAIGPSGGFLKKVFGAKQKTASGVAKARPDGTPMTSGKGKKLGLFGKKK